MAVQAHYPSNNVFFFNTNNNRGLQDGKNNECSLVDQDSIRLVPTDGVGNSRKRARENEIHVIAAMNRPMQPPSPPRPNVVSTGLRLAFGDQQSQQRIQQNSVSPPFSQSSLLFSTLADDLNAHIKQQSDEIDRFLIAQGEILRRTLEENRKRQYRALIGAAEEAISLRLKEKQIEMEKAARRNSELHARMAQLSAESQAWQARARSQEATAAAIQAQMQQVMASANRRGGDGNAATVVCAGGDTEDAESAYIDPDRIAAASVGPSCRACHHRVASAVVLPCRHLCLCAACDAAAQACPVCLSVKSSSVEVFFC
ncbi:unnamed protein product [Cuscuta campestris]|uniref:RING-type domain-containing protein n=1 Tax=Cuscuta campestris TaxID=132261 RepID=A0A484KWE1_9ASTE|nr:unnamed protein product [Cuscuta campestris]